MAREGGDGRGGAGDRGDGGDGGAGRAGDGGRGDGGRTGRERSRASLRTDAALHAVGIAVFLLVAVDGLGDAHRIASVTGALLVAAGLGLSLWARTPGVSA